MATPTYLDDQDDNSSRQLPTGDDVDELKRQTGELSGRLDDLLAEAEARDSGGKASRTSEPNAAADLVREKVASLYANEPSARAEVQDAKQAGAHRSQHQRFIYDLSTSGKSLAEIQTAWHQYYVSLSDSGKHKVWQEFYEMHGQNSRFAQAATPITPEIGQASPGHNGRSRRANRRHKTEPRTVADVKRQLVAKATAGGKLKAKHHLKSLLFGVGMGALVLFIVLFGFFNERFIAPFISPSRNVSATPIIATDDGTVGPESKILIPKINLEIPVVYDLGTNEEKAVQHALEGGVVHYEGTPDPGQQGNVVIVGHSSNNILNSGRYKFAFVLLKRMEAGDTMFLQKGGQRYTYQVIENRVVPPNDVSVLGPASKPNTVTLITCDPPGTSINRRIVIAEQISPDPAKNEAVELDTNLADPTILPSNAPSLWQRIREWF